MEKASPLDRMPYSVRKEKLRLAKQAEEAKIAHVAKPVSTEEEKAYVVEVQIPVTPEPILLQSKSPLEEPAVMSSPPAEPEPVVDNGPVEAEMVSSVVIETEELPEPEPVVVEEPIPAEPEPVAVEEAPVTGPEEAVVEEAPAAPAEPAVVEEEAPAAPAEPAVAEEEAPAEPAVVEEAPVEAPAEAVVVEEAATVTSEVVIEDVAEEPVQEVIEPKVEEEVLATPIIEDEKVEAPPAVEEKEPTPPPVVEEAPAAPVEENLELIDEEKRQKVLDLIYWRDVKKTGVVFGSMLFILLSLAIFSVLSVIAYLSLAILSVTLSFRVYKNIMQAVQKSGEGHPFKFYRDYLEWDIELNDQKTQKVVKLVMKHSNATVRELRRLFLVEDLVDSIKFGLLLWVLTYIGSWFNGMTLIINSVVIVFTLPKIYETYKVQIDNYLAMARSQFNKILQQVQSKLPFLKKKAKAQ